MRQISVVDHVEVDSTQWGLTSDGRTTTIGLMANCVQSMSDVPLVLHDYINGLKAHDVQRVASAVWTSPSASRALSVSRSRMGLKKEWLSSGNSEEPF